MASTYEKLACAVMLCFAGALFGAPAAAAQFGYVTQWGSTGSGPGQFQAPVDVAVDGSGNVYVVDSVLDSVQKFNSSGQFQVAFGESSGSACTQSGGPPPGELCSPNGVATSASSGATQVFVMNTYGGHIDRYGSDGSYQTEWGNLYCSGTGTKPPKPWFCFGSKVAAATNGIVYGDDGTLDIQSFNVNGESEGSWQAPLCNTAAGCSPQGLAADANGNLYIVDNSWSLVFATLGSLPGSIYDYGIWGGQGNLPGEFGAGVPASQQGPQGVAVGPNGNVYVADNLNDRIQVFQGLNGSVGSYITSFGTSGSGPGELDDPQGVAVDSAGNVFVADSGNDRIVQFAQLTPTPSPTPPPPVPTPNATPPQLRGLTTYRKHLRPAGKKRSPANRRLPSGTTLLYVLNEPATVTLRIKRRGKQVGDSIVQHARTGINRWRFSGRVGNKAFEPGRYVIKAQAVDAAGQATPVLQTAIMIVG